MRASSRPSGPGPWLLVVALALWIAVPELGWGQAKDRIGVTVTLYGDDQVGQSFAYALKEEVRKSSQFRLADAKDALLSIELTSLDESTSDQGKGHSSAIAYAFTMYNLLPYKKGDPQSWYRIYVGSGLLLCGSRSVDDLAKSVMARFDQAIEDYRAAAKSSSSREP